MGNANTTEEVPTDIDGFEVVDNPDASDPARLIPPLGFGSLPAEAPEFLRTNSIKVATLEAEPIVVAADDAMDDPDIEDVPLGDYVLHKCPSCREHEPQPYLGKGSFATVFHGTHVATNTPMAIKVIGIGKWYDKIKAKDGIKSLHPKQLKYIESEIDTLNTMKGHRHPNVVTFYSVIRSLEGRYVYLITELCEGGTLKDFLSHSGGCFDENTARRFLRHLAGGLYYIKTRPGNSAFVHRDLKPENFLLSRATQHATLKIADFGFSRVPEQNDGMMESVVGTPYYMAPEIHASQKYDDTVDLWAVGVVLFQSVFGRVLVDITSVKDLEAMRQKLMSTGCYREHLTEQEQSLNSNLSAPCQDLLERLLQPDPKKRISFQEFMSHPFIDLATAFVEQGEDLVSQVQMRELAERGFQILREKTDLQSAQFETTRAAMYEQDAQSKLELQQLRKQVRVLSEQAELSKKEEQEAVSETIRVQHQLDAVQMRTCELEAQQASLVAVDHAEIEDGHNVVFIRKAAADAQVAFEAVCASPSKYYLHTQCILEGMESRDYLVGKVFMKEVCEEGESVMLYANISP